MGIGGPGEGFGGIGGPSRFVGSGGRGHEVGRYVGGVVYLRVERLGG